MLRPDAGFLRRPGALESKSRERLVGFICAAADQPAGGGP